MQSEFQVWFLTQTCHPKLSGMVFPLRVPFPHFYLKCQPFPKDNCHCPVSQACNSIVLSAWLFLRLPLILKNSELWKQLRQKSRIIYLNMLNF